VVWCCGVLSVWCGMVWCGVVVGVVWCYDVVWCELTSVNGPSFGVCSTVIEIRVVCVSVCGAGVSRSQSYWWCVTNNDICKIH